MRLAEQFGIPIVPSSLIRLSSGELAYITRRIDRTTEGRKIHMVAMFQVLGAFDKYRGAMEKVGKAINTYSTSSLLDVGYFFDLALFCFLTGNNDMHLKNFSMILRGEWSLAPAYDLLNVAIVNPEDKEELALTIEGKKSKFSRKLFEQFGLGLGLTPRQIKSAFARMERHRAEITLWLQKSFLSQEYSIKYQALADESYEKLSISS